MKETRTHGASWRRHTPAGGEFDVFLHGDVFFDLVFTGLERPPRPGAEILTSGMGSLPGGIANLAVATARLGLRTTLAAGFGDDVYGQWCRRVLSEEGVDLTPSITVPQHTNVTVSMSYAGDRAMVTHGHDLPLEADELIGTVPPTRTVVTDLGAGRGEQKWWREAARNGVDIYADIGWDPTEVWDRDTLEPLRLCKAFVPNEVEATHYTGTEKPEDALAVLSEYVPLAIVTLGPDGAIGYDRATDTEVRAWGIPVKAIDPTGAGDAFMSAVVYGQLQHWSAQHTVDFAVLCSALSVTQFGGSLAAPGWGDVSHWYRAICGATVRPRSDCPGHEPNAQLAERYEFLRDAMPEAEHEHVRRAQGTFAAETEISERYPRLPWRELTDAWRARRSGLKHAGRSRRR